MIAEALHTARKASLPRFVSPSLATLSDKAPDGDNWVHEIKFDGYRIQAQFDRGKVKLFTRKALDWTEKFPTIAAAISKLRAKSAMFDGELVAENSNGLSSFSLLQQDLKASRHDRMVFYIFDLLHLDGADLTTLPLSTRKEALANLLSGLPERAPLRLSESLTGSGASLLRHACKMGLEGVVSKLANAPYNSGRSHEWIKTKCSDRQEFVVAGLVPSTADARAVGALVLGVYDGNTLKYAGRTGTGFSHEMARSLYRKLKSLEIAKAPFEAIPAEEQGARKPVWVQPKMVVEVDFRGWTHGDRVRQASFQGVREDKAAKDVVREQAIAAKSRTNGVRRSAPVKNGDVSVAGVHLTHPDRIYWDDVGITKRDLADFYVQIWKWMRPHLVGRPISLLRCPEGASGQCFFQKHARAGIPVDHLHLVPEKNDKIISVDDVDGVIALVQGGVLEIHVRGSTIDHLESADRLVFDLDPGPGTGWKDVVAAARDVRDRLRRHQAQELRENVWWKRLARCTADCTDPLGTSQDIRQNCRRSDGSGSARPIHRDGHQSQTQQAHLHRLSAQQPRSYGRCALLHARTPRRTGIGPDRLVGAEQPQERKPIHRSESCAADVPPAKRPVGQYRAHEPAIAEIQISPRTGLGISFGYCCRDRLGRLRTIPQPERHLAACSQYRHQNYHLPNARPGSRS